MAARRFARGAEFPHEGFVDEAVFRWAQAAGLRGIARVIEGYGREADLMAAFPDGRLFVVEAKGQTTSVGVDFNTGLGQLLKHMGAQDADYAIAVPDTPAFRAQMALVPDRVRRLLRLHWLVVAADGSVTDIPPPGEGARP